jgi:antitoxin MazE
METVLTKWGNSLGVRIPALIVKELSLKNGSIVEIKEKRKKIIIKQKKNSLIEMLNLINESNIHNEIKTDICVGKEIW